MATAEPMLLNHTPSELTVTLPKDFVPEVLAIFKVPLMAVEPVTVSPNVLVESVPSVFERVRLLLTMVAAPSVTADVELTVIL